MQPGFSLIELMIVLTIMVILSIMVVPSQKIFFDQAESQTLNSELLQAIRLTRDEAISCGEMVKLSSNDKWQSDYHVTVNNKVIRIFKYHADEGRLHWRSSLKRHFLEFEPQGSARENGTFWYCSDHSNNPSWAIVVSLSGRAREVLPDKAGEIRDAEGKVL